MGLTVSLYYAFTTNYITVYDASRDYWLYNYYRVNPVWHQMEGLYALQNTSLFSTYIPAIVQRITHLPAEGFFKVYISVWAASVPVVAYLISKKFVGKGLSLFSALYIMGWVAFYQGGSFARLNVAVAIFGLVILALLSNWRHRYIIAGIGASLLPFAHYGTAVIAVIIIGGYWLCLLIKRSWRKTAYIGLLLLALTGVFWYWHAVENKLAWAYLSALINDTSVMAKQGALNSGVFDSVVLRDGQAAGSNMPTSLMSRDRITQAFFGVNNPDNAGVFRLNYYLLFFAWLTVMLMGYGAWVVLRGRYPDYKGMVFWSFVAIGLTILIPQISRGYGIEKVYYQAIVVTAPCLVLGGHKVASKLHIPAWVFLSAVLIPYVGLMWVYGVIPSVLG